MRTTAQAHVAAPRTPPRLARGPVALALLALGMALARVLPPRSRGAERADVAVILALLVIGAVPHGVGADGDRADGDPGLFVSQGWGWGAGSVGLGCRARRGFRNSLLLGKRPYSRPLRQLLWLNLFYQFTTLFTVIVNPDAANTIEWFHAWLLVSGALIVGWALGRAGYARLALATMVVTACVIAVGTYVSALLQYARGDFSPVYPAGRSRCTRTSRARRWGSAR